MFPHLVDKIKEIYKVFIQESGIQFSELEEKVLQFHLSNLEYACGSNLHEVSIRRLSRMTEESGLKYAFKHYKTEQPYHYLNMSCLR